ncbi:MAG: hypothetical protein LPK07_13460 [Hymenobacteraceae bacterium]|nr:hypothetical protein [Hymenobacteraceae bacterium]MDX5482682.1 hypothetical protein [Hymenobacteraceae bacterium]
MEQVQVLLRFFTAALHDPRIGTSHIALYVAFYQRWVKEGSGAPVLAYSHEMMPVAKICSSATYHRVLRELDAYGYLQYEPSFSRLRRSRVCLDGAGRS